MKDDMYTTALDWINSGRKVALATVIATWGSSPRPVGSQLIADDDGAFEGSVSGGCIEGAVVAEALDVIGHGKPQRIVFGVSRNQPQSTGLACGGEIEIFIEKVSSGPWLTELTELSLACRGACLITDLKTGDKTVVPLDVPDKHKALGEDIAVAVGRTQARGENFTMTLNGCSYFFHGIHPPPQMVVVGAVHIAQPLVVMARMQGYDVTVIDPRCDFATRNRFPDVRLIEAWPADALQKIQLHGRTAIVVLSHDPKFDDPALKAALASDVFYIGALGSKKTHAARLERLQLAGFSEKALMRICGPVGLAIGAVTAEEIALSIMAQITRKHRLGN